MPNKADDFTGNEVSKLPNKLLKELRGPTIVAYSVKQRVTQIKNNLDSTLGKEKIPTQMPATSQVIDTNLHSFIKNNTS